MSGKSKIEWTDATWNPTVGCTKVTAGCRECYAERIHDMRHKAYLEGKKVPQQYAEPFGKIQLMRERLLWSTSVRGRKLIFVDSMSDLFHEAIPTYFINKVFDTMAACPEHIFQVLTKRIGRAKAVLSEYNPGVLSHTYPLPNVWIGTSVEIQETADKRIPLLLETPAAHRFLSIEPLLGPTRPILGKRYCKNCNVIHWTANPSGYGFVKQEVYCPKCGYAYGYFDNSVGCSDIEWVIVGGESGPGARSLKSEWVENLQVQCERAHVPFFFKQWGEYAPVNAGINEPAGWDGMVMKWLGKLKAGHILNGKEYREMPKEMKELREKK